jgi:hypothetical protein
MPETLPKPAPPSKLQVQSAAANSNTQTRAIKENLMPCVLEFKLQLASRTLKRELLKSAQFQARVLGGQSSASTELVAKFTYYQSAANRASSPQTSIRLCLR